MIKTSQFDPAALPTCPACGRRVASIRIAKCLFCNTPFAPEEAERLQKLRQLVPEDGSMELRRALLVGLGPSAATGAALRQAGRRGRGLGLLVTVGVVLCLLVFGAGTLLVLSSRGGLDLQRMIGSVRSLATVVGAMVAAAVVIALVFLIRRR